VKVSESVGQTVRCSVVETRLSSLSSGSVKTSRRENHLVMAGVMMAVTVCRSGHLL
jgi:hypothetical protein